MKRDPIPRGVYQTFPLFFWLTCKECGQEFRREPGWRVLDGPLLCYICRRCAPTANDARTIGHRSAPCPAPLPRCPPRRHDPQCCWIENGNCWCGVLQKRNEGAPEHVE